MPATSRRRGKRSHSPHTIKAESKSVHKRSKGAGAVAQATLCSICQHLDLEKACRDADEYFSANWDLVLGLREWKNGRDGFEGLPIATIGSSLADSSVACPACRFFDTMKPLGSADTSYTLRAFPSYWALPFIKLSASTIRSQDRTSQPCALMMVPDDMKSPSPFDQVTLSYCIFPITVSSRASVSPRRITPLVDLNQAKEWIEFCDANHNIECPKLKARRGNSTEVPGFRLIDCHTREIVKSSIRRSYVALSYVWGGSSNEETGFPRVVEDALQVCKELGYKYLWVDQYCIDQNNLGEKMQQIANMHLVYQCAQLTIMAAAGTDASYGLPGVSLDRTPTSSIKIGAIELLAVPRDPHESIKRSRWWERGWTYQEGVMSRRRLFFTEDQIYYECGGMVGYECFQLPDDLFHVASLLYQLPFMRGSIFSMPHKTISSFILDYTENTEMRTQRLFYHTENYSRRKLSFDTDSLNAFKGILAVGGVPSVFGLIGLTTIPNLVDAGIVNDQANNLAKALVSWWHCRQGAKRVAEFPSWTWTGWRGGIKTYSETNRVYLPLQESGVDNDHSISSPLMYLLPVREEDKSVKRWWFDYDTPKLVQMSFGKQLNIRQNDIAIQAPVVDLVEQPTTLHVAISNDVGFSMDLNLSIQADGDSLIDSVRNKWALVLMARTAQVYYFLVLRETFPDSLPSWTKKMRTWKAWTAWERIGISCVDIVAFREAWALCPDLLQFTENYVFL